ncbi:hypothetical protein GCM10020256_04700 [Streptomyces thermocoprophilus]
MRHRALPVGVKGPVGALPGRPPARYPEFGRLSSGGSQGGEALPAETYTDARDDADGTQEASVYGMMGASQPTQGRSERRPWD